MPNNTLRCCGVPAVIALVDSNLHRENILPSEKAFAYKMKLEAVMRQGERNDLKINSTCGQVGHKSRDAIADNESGRQVQRYIRLTELYPQILEMVDAGKIAFSPAVEISYLPMKEQKELFNRMEIEDRTPSLSQTQRMRKISANGRLDVFMICRILAEEKPNQKEQIKLKVEDISKFFPQRYDTGQMQEVIMKLLTEWQRKRERNSRDAR